MHKQAFGNRREIQQPAARLPLWSIGAFAVAGALLLAACGSDGTAAASGSAPGRKPLYFDVKGLLSTQIEQLTTRRAAVTKQVSLRGGPLETTAVPAVKWADELQIFFQADINKAALRGAYAVDSTLVAGDTGQRYQYTRRAGYKNAPVEQLTVLSESGQPTEIQATITQTNPLFAASKRLRLRLQQGQLVQYGVTGTQKLVLFDTLRYATAATVR